jgi:endo-1,3(4)-beta-glucanase
MANFVAVLAFFLGVCSLSSASPILSYTDPATIKLPNGNLFGSYFAQDDRAPVQSLWTENALKNPLPTNSWWSNLIIGTGRSKDNAVLSEPYMLQGTDNGVSLYYGFVLNSTPQQMGFDWVDSFPVTLQASESTLKCGVDAWDDMSVQYQCAGATGSMMAPLVRGASYVSMKYQGLTPRLDLSTLTIDNATAWAADGSITFPEAKPASGQVFHGIKFELKLRELDQTYRIYSSEPITLTYANQGLAAAQPLADGYLRIGIVNNCTWGYNTYHCPPGSKGEDTSQYTALMDAHSDAVVTGGTVHYSVTHPVDPADTVVTYKYAWTKESMTAASAGSALLMQAMPHQVSSFDAATAAGLVEGTAHVVLRGRMQAVVGDVWQTVLTMPVNGWTAFKPIPADKKQDLLDALLDVSTHPNWNVSEVDWLPPLNWQLGVGDTYFSGKVYARMARVALIAEELGEHDAALTVATRLRDYLTIWLGNTNPQAQPMMYDRNWGGLLSCGCNYDDCNGKCDPKCDNLDASGKPTSCPEMLDPGSSFGAGFYNDHHFHYGYFLYSFAAAGHFFPEWLAQYKEHTLLYARDIANPDPADPFFPTARHKDWFTGFSWASGFAVVYRNGRNQESSSEAVNAYFGVYSYGLACQDQNISDLGLALLAHEIHGVQTYYQIPTSSEVYPRGPNTYPDANQVVGIMWQSLIQYSTYFGMDPTYVHGIQHLPYTPTSTVLLDPNWVKDEWKAWDKTSNQGWFVTQQMNQAIVQPTAVYSATLLLDDTFYAGNNAGSNGNSRLNTLYWMATQ